MRTEKKVKFERIIKFASLTSLFVLLGTALFYFFIFARCFFSVKRIPEITSYPVMHVLFYGSSPDTVSARFTILDTDGKEFCIIDRSWNGQSLSVDFTSASFGGKEFLFPLSIRSSKAGYENSARSGGGTFLPKYYLEDGECILLSSRYSSKIRAALKNLCFFAIWQSKRVQSKYSKIYSLELSGLKTGSGYEIVIDSKGSLKLLQM